MTLRWSTDRITEDVTGPKDWEITKALIMATVGIGMPKISERNVEVFTTRLYAFQRIHGPLVQEFTNGELRAVQLTLAQVRRRIGLTTNAAVMNGSEFKLALADEILTDARRLTVHDRDMEELIESG